MSKTSKGKTDWAEIIKKNKRPHAGLYSWRTNRNLEELGALRDFDLTLLATKRKFFTDPLHRGQGKDPPDCEALNLKGERIGIEITELVDEVSIKRAVKKQPANWKNWKGELIPKLQEILKDKDSPATLNDGPYFGYVLLIFTDEPWLEEDYARESLENHLFEKTKLISKAFFMLSWSLKSDRKPLFELNFKDKR